MKTRFVLVAVFGLLCSFATFNATQWQPVDEEYTIKFHSRSAKGTIKGLKGTIHFDSTDLPHSGFDVTVDVSTLNTGNTLKNKHALAQSFFDVEQYPTIGFVSDSISTTDPFLLSEREGRYYVHGRLRIKDVTKNIIPFQLYTQWQQRLIYRALPYQS